MQIILIILLILIVVPLPLVWAIGTIFPNGYTDGHTQRIRGYFIREWRRILICAVIVGVMFIVSPDRALQVTLIGAAFLVGRFFAVGRG